MLVLLVRHLSKTFDVGFTCTSFKQDLKLPTSSSCPVGELHKGALLWLVAFEKFTTSQV